MTKTLRAIKPPGSTIVLILGLAQVAIAGVATAEDGYVGSETCAECHDDVAAAFQLSAHGRAELGEWSSAEGCESCHGPGQAHAEDGDEMVAAAANDARMLARSWAAICRTCCGSATPSSDCSRTRTATASRSSWSPPALPATTRWCRRWPGVC